MWLFSTVSLCSSTIFAHRRCRILPRTFECTCNMWFPETQCRGVLSRHYRTWSCREKETQESGCGGTQLLPSGHSRNHRNQGFGSFIRGTHNVLDPHALHAGSVKFARFNENNPFTTSFSWGCHLNCRARRQNVRWKLVQNSNPVLRLTLILCCSIGIDLVPRWFVEPFLKTCCIEELERIYINIYRI